jgi:hypothetical protein
MRSQVRNRSINSGVLLDEPAAAILKRLHRSGVAHAMVAGCATMSDTEMNAKWRGRVARWQESGEARVLFEIEATA